MARNKKKIYREEMIGTHFTRGEVNQMIRLVELTCAMIAILWIIAIFTVKV